MSEDAPKNIFSLKLQQAEEFFINEFKKFQKNLEAVYREDLVNLGMPEKEATVHAQKQSKSHFKKFRKKYLRQHREHLLGEAHIRSHPDYGK
ncbi:hypothetical protein WDW89_07660 [Deltaproteobacteria bacterium TL4]